MNSIYKDKITLCGMATEDRWFDSTLKALIYSKKITGISKVQMLSAKQFDHPEVEYIGVRKFNSLQEYNLFMMREYHKHISTEFMINIHDDGFVINPEAWTDEFLQYDYIGALWPVGCHVPSVKLEDRCGNGGFSLRSKKFMELVEKHCPFHPYIPEDSTVCRVYRQDLINLGLKFPPDHIAAQFSIEDDSIPEAKGQSHKDRFSLKCFGFHNINSDARKFLENISI